MDTRRQKKTESFIQREVGEIIRKEVSDPRIGFFTITLVKVAPDMKFAKILVSCMGSEKEKEQTFDGLRCAGPFIQHKLAKRLATKFSPVIQFALDDSTAFRVEELLSEIKREEDEKKPGVAE